MKAERDVGVDPLGVARFAGLVMLAVEIAVLVASGVWLVFNYRPSVDAGLPVARVRYPIAGIGWIRATHRYVSALAIVTSLGAAALVVADALVHDSGRRRVVMLVLGPLLVFTVAAASFTGYLLPWDQLALWAVTAGANFKGYKAVFGPDVRFVLLGGSEISQSTLWRWFIVHVVVLTLAISALFAATAKLRPSRRQRAEPLCDSAPAPD
jgi:quinol-cytochrome oxidoreductase complex cytochrome b subunit